MENTKPEENTTKREPYADGLAPTWRNFAMDAHPGPLIAKQLDVVYHDFVRNRDREIWV